MNRASPVLAANAVSCLIFGAALALAPGAAAAFLSDMPAPALLVRMLGIVLIANGVHLAVSAGRAQPIPAEWRYFALGDAAWVAGTGALVAGGVWITAPAAIATALVLAVLVAGFGIVQWHEAGRAAPPAPSDA